MNRIVRFLSFFMVVLVLEACSQTKGYKIVGKAPLKSFEGNEVYMKDAYTGETCDSAKIVDGHFYFQDTKEVEKPLVRILSVKISDEGLEYRLPVAIENGEINATIASVVRTEGTSLNDKLQEFLIAIDRYSEGCKDKPVEQIKIGFSELLKEHIEINNDNVVGEYIKNAYKGSL